MITKKELLRELIGTNVFIGLSNGAISISNNLDTSFCSDTVLEVSEELLKVSKGNAIYYYDMKFIYFIQLK